MPERITGNRALETAREFAQLLGEAAAGLVRYRRRDVVLVTAQLQAAATLALAEEQRVANEIAQRSHLLRVKELVVANEEDMTGPLAVHLEHEMEALGVRVRRGLGLAPAPRDDEHDHQAPGTAPGAFFTEGQTWPKR